MSHPGLHNKKPSSGRRRFLRNTVSLAVLGTILTPLDSCTDNKKSGKDSDSPGISKKKSNSRKTSRKKWSYEKLVVNSKTNVVHFPTSRLYTYYDEILPAHVREVGLAAWVSQMQEPVKFHKHQSGNILEILAMNDLARGVNNDSLASATNTLAMAFSPECDNSNGTNYNITNFRLHELMLQFIALNSTIPPESKWTTFNARIKKPESLRKRQKWMEAEANFNDRVNYILERQNDYIARLTNRASRYSFI